MSSEGNWKGSDTGTRPPSMPKLSGREEGLPSRGLPAEDTDRWEVTGGVAMVPVRARLPTTLFPWEAPPTALCLCVWLTEGAGLLTGDMLIGLLLELAPPPALLLTDGAFWLPAKL